MEYTPSQLRALSTLDKSLVVIASAGSGKTRVLVGRYERLIRSQEFSPAQILAFTFTIKAAGEIKERLIQAGVLSPIDEAYAPIGTIHSFIMGLLKTHGHMMGLKPDFDIMSESEAILLRHSFIKNWLLKKLDDHNSGIESGVAEWGFRETLKLFLNLSQDANMAIYKNEESAANDSSDSLDKILPLFLECQNEFLLDKIRRATLDFSDLEVVTLKLLQKKSTLLAQIQAKYRHILVDEFQDINPIQGQIISLLFQPEVNHLFIVGDPKQSIYRFRKADVAVFHAMSEAIVKSGGEIIQLNETFRLAPKLAHKINQLFKPLFEEQPEDNYLELVPQRTDLEGTLKIVIAPTSGEKMSTIRQAEAMHIAAALKKFRNNPFELKQSAVLLRSGTYISIYADELKKQGIPFHMVKTGSLLKEPVVVDLLHLLNYFSGHTDLLTMAGILRSPLFGLSEFFLDHFIKNRPSDFNSGFATDLFADPLDQARWGELAPLIKKWMEFKQNLAPKSLFLEILADLGFFGTRATTFLPGFIHSVYPDSQYPVEQFLTLIEAPSSEFTDAYQHFQQLFENLLIQDETLSSLETAVVNDGVSLMSIHASKGLEFKRVFLPELHGRTRHDGHMFLFDKNEGLKAKREDKIQSKGLKKTFLELEPYRKAKEIEITQERLEMKRVLYVAMTRAKDELTLFVKNPKSSNIVEAKTWNEWIWHYLKDDWDQGQVLDRSGARDAGFVQLADRIENRLEQSLDESSSDSVISESLPDIQTASPQLTTHNVTELEAFYRCGKFFELAYLKGLAGGLDATSDHEPTITATQWGNLVHEMLQFLDFQTLNNRSTVIDQALINQGLADASQTIRSRLNQTLDQLLADPEILRLLQSSPYECEKEFLLSQNDFFIKGTIDRLTLDQGIWHIIDYKTDATQNDRVFQRKVELYQFQLGLYAVAASRILHVPTIKTSLLFTQGPKLVTKLWSAQDLETQAQQASDLHARMTTSNIYHYPEDKTLCPSCPYYALNYCGVRSVD